MVKTLLLTGATGFVGSNLLGELIKQGYEVIILKRSFSDCWRIKSLLGKVKSYDIDEIPIEKIFDSNRIDCVIHLATYYKKRHNREDIGKFIGANIRLPIMLLEQMAIHNIRYFINTGTFSEYKLDSKLISEKTRKKAYNLYAAFKISFSEILKYYCNSCNIKAIDLKLFSLYGPKDNEKLFLFLIKNFIENSHFEISKGEQRWNWTYVKDIVEAYIKALKYLGEMKSNYEVFNIGQNKVYSIREIISLIEQLSGNKGLASYSKDYVENEIFYVNCDNEKAKKSLGWVPEYDLNKGLEETYRYCLESGRKNERK